MIGLPPVGIPLVNGRGFFSAVSELESYNYELPRELIAQHPLAERSDARLLVIRKKTGEIDHFHIRDLPDLLVSDDCLVLNDTRVIQARLVGYRLRTKGRWQGLFLSEGDQGFWRMLCKTRGHLIPGEQIQLVDRDARPAITLQMGAKLPGGEWVARPNSAENAMTLLERIGRVPLPPYIRGGEMVDADLETYQTVYATHTGAVAAPTAGLHITQRLLEQLSRRGIQAARLTLHIGQGTFRPISADSLANHTMHREWGSIDATAVERIHNSRSAKGRTIAVGTTTVRVLETAAATGQLRPWEGQTDLFIRPPHSFRAVDGLLTNFHLPRTTLLILVRTLGGNALVQRAYEAAIQERYRFYSYGDAMLILP